MMQVSWNRSSSSFAAPYSVVVLKALPGRNSCKTSAEMCEQYPFISLDEVPGSHREYECAIQDHPPPVAEVVRPIPGMHRLLADFADKRSFWMLLRI